jgi:hypothetical protein
VNEKLDKLLSRTRNLYENLFKLSNALGSDYLAFEKYDFVNELS